MFIRVLLGCTETRELGALKGRSPAGGPLAGGLVEVLRAAGAPPYHAKTPFPLDSWRPSCSVTAPCACWSIKEALLEVRRCANT